MPGFHYHKGNLFVEDCDLNSLATTYGTPAYVYSRAAITEAYQAYASALGDRGKVCYAVKANSNLAVLQILAELGAGFDIVSRGELERVLLAGGSPNKIIFSGVGKTAAEIRRALEVGIACFNVESAAELEQIAAISAEMGKCAPVSLRVNPDVDAKTHPYISTGLKENKFGIDFTVALDVYERAANYTSVNVIGIDCHIGSQLVSDAPFIDALNRLLHLVDALSEKGIIIQHLDLGGGLGVTYQNERPPAIADYVSSILEKLQDRNLQLIFEPGRSIVANAGALLTEVLYLKPTETHNFAIVDAAMNDNIRPSLYQAWQNVLPLKENQDGDELEWDIVGPICETSDFLAKNRKLSLHQGDRLALMSSGAYGFVMSSNYNTRPRVCELLVDQDKCSIVRERETFEDMIKGEKLLNSI